ncbi:MAG TPA: sulfotransferase family 2 domain-containing protein [Nocardioides sp.]|jgi:hypothetical protein|nr:sulfotransferase family 2 domain-containing protein [Nocardioides sp.]
MKISDAHRMVFVHVPKCGGSTIDDLFVTHVPDHRKVRTPDRRHATFRQIVDVDPKVADYWSFGFVRNPWARMVSWWSMGNDVHQRAREGRPHAVRNVTKRPYVWDAFRPYLGDFRKFVLEGTVENARFGQPQMAWLTKPDGRMLDFVGRVEQYDDDVNVVRERLGLDPLPVQPRKNPSSHGHYSDYYDDETRARVAEVFAPDIEAFGYTFEVPAPASSSAG